MQNTTSTLLSTVTGGATVYAGFNFWQFLGATLLAWLIGKALDYFYNKLK